jgi:hypothetical protein
LYIHTPFLFVVKLVMVYSYSTSREVYWFKLEFKEHVLTNT